MVLHKKYLTTNDAVDAVKEWARVQALKGVDLSGFVGIVDASTVSATVATREAAMKHVPWFDRRLKSALRTTAQRMDLLILACDSDSNSLRWFLWRPSLPAVFKCAEVQ